MQINSMCFFPFAVRPSIIRYSHLINAAVLLGSLGGKLQFNAETVLLNRDAFDDLCPEDLVTRLHVREVKVGKQLGKHREDASTR